MTAHHRPKIATNSPKKEYSRAGVGIISIRKNKVLLGPRLGPNNHHEYGLPGGALEEGETFLECAIRELYEETGWSGRPLYPISLSTGYIDTEAYIDVIYYYDCGNEEAVVMEKDRVANWDWIALSKLLSMEDDLYGPSRLALRDFITNRNLYRINLFIQKYLGLVSGLLTVNDGRK